MNRRVTKTIGGNTRHFYYTDKWQVIEERLNTSTSAERQFVWGIRYTDDLVLRDRDTDTDGAVDDERLYAIQDYFQPTAVLDTSGVVQERYGYEAFGTSRVMTASYGTRTSSSYDWETRFGAYRWDGETGLLQVRNRYLHSGLGRWGTRDPMSVAELVEGTNLYSYVGNNSINVVDVFGLASNVISIPAAVASGWSAQMIAEIFGITLLAAEALIAAHLAAEACKRNKEIQKCKEDCYATYDGEDGDFCRSLRTAYRRNFCWRQAFKRYRDCLKACGK
jgi:RHS repeat-associated protein